MPMWVIYTGIGLVGVVLVLIAWKVFKLPGFLQKHLESFNKETGSKLDVLIELGRGHKDDLRLTGKEIREEVITQISKLSNVQIGYLKTVNDQLNKVLAQVETKLEKIRRENFEQLEKIRGVVDEKLNETLHKRLAQHFSSLQDMLDKVSKSVGEVRSISAEMVDLKRVFSGVKTRGVWGELQLERLLSDFLREGTQFIRNVPMDKMGREKVEFAILIPDKQAEDQKVLLPIDAKFPLDVFSQLLKAYEEADKAQIQKATQKLASAVKTQAQKIKKYIKPPKTTNFAIMYLPVESLYAEVVKIPGLMEEVQQRFNVIITGPNTFTAFVLSLQMGFKTLTIQKRTQEVWRLLALIRKDFDKFGMLLEATINDLEKTKERLEEAMKRTKYIQNRVNKLEDIREEPASSANLVEIPQNVFAPPTQADSTVSSQAT